MRSVRVQVPGKILLAGEYAVLDGHPALSLAVERFLTVTLTLGDSQGWILHSELWPEPVALDNTRPQDIAHEPLLQVADFAQHHFALPHVKVSIHSELDVRFGLGSSSALRLGVLLGAAALAQQDVSLPEFALEAAALAYRMQLVQQSFASGYDVLTQALGGLILWTPDYQNWPGPSIRKLDASGIDSHLQVFVGGAGAPTKQVGSSVRHVLADASLQRAYYAASDAVIDSWLHVLQNGEDALLALCQDIAAQRRIFAELPYFPQTLFHSLDNLPGFDQTWTAKTTGAGGEDAVLLIGTRDATREAAIRLQAEGWYPLPVQPSHQGARVTSGITS